MEEGVDLKILLVRPMPPKETIGLKHIMICEPLELEYLVANIDKACDVQILDMIIEKKSLKHFIEKYNPDIVGLTGYITHVKVIKDYAKEIKEINKDIKVIAGGVHAEVVPSDFVSKHIDYIIESDPVATFNRIIDVAKEEINQRRNNNIDNSYINDIHIQGTYKEGFKNPKVNTWPKNHPDRAMTKRYRNKYYYMFHNPCALMKTSYGCPYNCSFCFCKEITDGRYYARPIDDVIDELKTIPENEIYIVDDDFLFSRERLTEFCDKLEQNKIKKRFLVYGRSDFVSENEDIIKRLAENGLRAVIVGLESFKREELDIYNKKTSIEANEKAVNILQKYDIEVYATLIMHMDYDKEDFKNLGKWIKGLGLMFVNLQPLTPLPGTDIYEEYERSLIIKREDYEKWDLAHLALMPSKMSIRSYYIEIIKLYYSITMRPKNVWKMIKTYGISQVLKLSLGSSAVTFQYIKKAIKG
ncbi:B12-binding domain-containing radical SAM protein [Acetoanaerobium pronyense]|uniref:B12-binding domain-containing radical SAM protein n=1 Tax=Acetoanaerobium pronyense TaxID=1482736 RepID=UPI001FD8F1FE|nr:radical SAM protein [Acetoanaerobium pronyense]